MPHLLIAFAGEKTRRRMEDIFEAAGIHVSVCCGSGAELLRLSESMPGGVILCGYKLYDMTADSLMEDLPSGFSTVLLAVQDQLDACTHPDVCKLAAPARKTELVETVKMLLDAQEQSAPPPSRSLEEKLLIARAKELLMTRNQMTESQAHRFLQKRSMDTGAKLVQTAMKILDGQLVL